MNDTKTVTGAIVHVTDADEAPLVRCLVDITPKQSGTGTPSPSNVRPISGWESVDVNVTGKNILKNERTTATIGGVTFTVNEDKSVTANGTATQNVYFLLNTSRKIEAKAGVTYRLTGCPSGGSGYIIYNDSHGMSDSGSGSTYTPTADDEWDFFIRIANGTAVNNVLFKPMLRVKQTGDNDEYEPYNGTINTTTLGRTVYGGTLDVVTGVLTVDKVGVDLGSLTWSKYGNYTDKDRYVTTGIDSNANNDETNAICSIYPRLWGANGWWIGSGSGKLSIFTTYGQYSSVSAFKTAMSGQTLVYPLATPQTYTLTGQEVSAMYGENYIWANSGDTTIEYTYLPYGLYGEIRLDGEFLPKPRDFKPGREDVYAGEYTTCTGKTIADKIGWKFSDLDLQWDALKQSDIDKLINLTNACSLRFDDADGLHTEDVIRTSAVSLRNRNTIDGVTWWRDVSAQFKFINTHNE